MIYFTCEVRDGCYLCEYIEEGQKLKVNDHVNEVGEEENMR